MKNDLVLIQHKTAKKSQHDCCRQIITGLDVSPWLC